MRLKHLLICSFCWLTVSLGSTELVKLRTEYTDTPLGLDVEKPRFSWQLHSTLQGHLQTAYQLTVCNEEGTLVWNSGKVRSDQSVNIEYAGSKLAASTLYTWQVIVWDNMHKQYKAESWFETGLLNADPELSAWDGAKWIGARDEDRVFYPYYLPVFKMSITLQLDSLTKSTRAGFIYGANDPRLMDKNMNIYGLGNSRDSSYLRIELNTGALEANQKATIDLYRSGYAPEDKKNQPFKSFVIPEQLLNRNNRFRPHTLYIASVLGQTRIYINGEKASCYIGEANLNPLGRGGDYIAFPTVSEIGFYVPALQRASFSEFTLRHYRQPSNRIFNTFATPLQVTAGNKDSVFSFIPSGNPMPMLRSTFTTKSKVKKARLYATARGIYDFYINGKRIGNDYFNPGATQYTKTQLYQTFDVTNYLVNGRNAMGAILGEGWWSGASTYMGEYWNFFGDQQSLLARLEITYTDGTRELVTTRPETWTYCNEGPLVYSSFFQGEVYDARKEELVKNWSEATFNDSAWKKCVEVPLIGTINTEAGRGNVPGVSDYSNLQIRGQLGETVQQIRELKAKSVEEIRPGVYVYDMGQNMAGIPSIRLSGMTPGQQITLRFAEVKYPDLPAYRKHTGMIGKI